MIDDDEHDDDDDGTTQGVTQGFERPLPFIGLALVPFTIPNDEWGIKD